MTGSFCVHALRRKIGPFSCGVFRKFLPLTEIISLDKDVSEVTKQPLERENQITFLINTYCSNYMSTKLGTLKLQQQWGCKASNS